MPGSPMKAVLTRATKEFLVAAVASLWEEKEGIVAAA